MSGVASADYRPSYCPERHDHRVHAPNYYDYYQRDRYYNDRYDNTRRRADVRYNRGYDNGYRARGNRVLSRKVLDTRFRARIVVREEIVYTRRGKRLLCTISTRGPESHYVPRKRLKRVAYNYCSPRARVRYYT